MAQEDEDVERMIMIFVLHDQYICASFGLRSDTFQGLFNIW